MFFKSFILIGWYDIGKGQQTMLILVNNRNPEAEEDDPFANLSETIPEERLRDKDMVGWIGLISKLDFSSL